MDQPESWNQAPIRADQHHCDSGHSSPKPDGSNSTTCPIPTKVSSMEQPAQGGCRLRCNVASSMAPTKSLLPRVMLSVHAGSGDTSFTMRTLLRRFSRLNHEIALAQSLTH